jgi:preflagellin peptidase FlaK
MHNITGVGIATVVDIGPLTATGTDLLRLTAVPVFAWATWRDIKTRRVPNKTWVPLLVLGVLTLLWDGWVAYSLGGYDWRTFALPAAISIGFVIPLAYGFWLLGGFGGADVKALIVLALLFPTFPTYFVEVAGVPALPVHVTTTRSFAFTLLTNTVILGIVYPLGLALRNVLRGHTSLAMFVGKPVHWSAIPELHGRLLEDEDGLTRGGLDLDALRMYLRWRGTTLPTIRDRTDDLRDPDSLPSSPNPPTDGNVTRNAEALTDGGAETETSGDPTTPPTEHDAATADRDETPADQSEASEYDDPWGAEAFLDDVEHAYGTSPAQLRAGLDLLATEEVVWISPGIPFIVPMFGGLVVGLVYGDLLFGALSALGLV